VTGDECAPPEVEDVIGRSEHPGAWAGALDG
jgi:hypothetical protein